MAVIADFAAYPQWATGVRAAEVLSQQADGRASRVRFTLDAGLIKDTYVLGYDWDGDRRVRWELAEAGSVVSEMSGGYELAERGLPDRGHLRPHRGCPGADDWDGQTPGREDDHRYRAQGAQVARRDHRETEMTGQAGNTGQDRDSGADGEPRDGSAAKPAGRPPAKTVGGSPARAAGGSPAKPGGSAAKPAGGSSRPPGSDLADDIQRWLVRSGIRSMRRELTDQVRRTFDRSPARRARRHLGGRDDRAAARADGVGRFPRVRLVPDLPGRPTDQGDRPGPGRPAGRGGRHGGRGRPGGDVGL